MALDFLGFALEKVLLGLVPMPGEYVRAGLALAGLLAASYYDISNRRNIPDRLLYAFFIVAVGANLAFFDAGIATMGVLVAVLLAVFGYGLYRMGQWGMADVLAMVSIALLLPVHPSWAAPRPNYPFVLSVFLFSFVLFALYMISYYGWKLAKKGKGVADRKYLLLLLPYAVLIYLLATLPVSLVVLSPAYLLILSITVLASVFYLVYRNPIQDLLSERLPLSKAEDGDVVVLERMGKEGSDYKIPRVLTAYEIGRLRRLKVKEIWVYAHLPPFLPFLLVGTVLALLGSPMLLGQ